MMCRPLIGSHALSRGESIDIAMHVYYTCRRSTIEKAIAIVSRRSDASATGLVLVGGGSDAALSTKTRTRIALRIRD